MASFVSKARRRVREARVFAKGLKSPHHPILAHLVPIRRCNLSCTYCNEFDQVSSPVPIETVLKRVDLLAGLGTSAVHLSGGEPMLHPELSRIICRIRSQDMLAGLLTNGLLLSEKKRPEKVPGLFCGENGDSRGAGETYFSEILVGKWRDSGFGFSVEVSDGCPSRINEHSRGLDEPDSGFSGGLLPAGLLSGRTIRFGSEPSPRGYQRLGERCSLIVWNRPFRWAAVFCFRR